MVFVIELSFYLHQHLNFSSFKKTLQDIALEYNCITYYFLEEIRGLYDYDDNLSISKYGACNMVEKNAVCIQVVHFPSDIKYVKYICDYIRNIKKVRQVVIESVYRDDIQSQILYSSKYYNKCINKIDKELERRGRSYSDSELIVMDELNRYKKKSKKCVNNILDVDVNKSVNNTKTNKIVPKSYDEYLECLNSSTK